MVAEVNTRTDQLPVSVIIVNYNAGRLLAECIHSALPSVSEVLVVDNASSDFSLELCTQRFPEEPKLKIIRNTVNLGFRRRLQYRCRTGYRTVSLIPQS